MNVIKFNMASLLSIGLLFAGCGEQKESSFSQTVSQKSGCIIVSSADSTTDIVLLYSSINSKCYFKQQSYAPKGKYKSTCYQRRSKGPLYSINSSQIVCNF